MKSLKHQFYNEGFATTFYQKPKSKINKIKNKKVKNILNIILTVFYTLIMILIAAIVLYYKLK